jgi:hypothetical protein
MYGESQHIMAKLMVSRLRNRLVVIFVGAVPIAPAGALPR